MINIFISDSYFKSQSEAAALCSILHSYRRFCGLFYNDFMLEFSGNVQDCEKGRVCLSVDGKRKMIDIALSDADRIFTSVAADRILKEVSILDRTFEWATFFFLEYRLWELEFLFLFCEKSRDIREQLLVKYQEDMLQKRLKQYGVDNRYTEYMEYYYRYLIKKLQWSNQSGRLGANLRIDYFDFAEDSYIQWRRTGNILYCGLACSLWENIGDVDSVEKLYMRYIQNLRKLKYADYEISNAFYDMGRYLEKNSDKDEKTLDYHYRMIDYYRKSFEYNRNNFRTVYKLVFSANGLYDFGDGILAQVTNLRCFLKKCEKTIDTSLRVFLYDYKVTCHLGVLELKANNDPDTALELFKEAEKLFDVTVMNIWKRLELDRWFGSEKELLNFVHAEVVYNYMENIYLQYEGANSKEYIEIQEKRKNFMKQFD